MNLTSNLVINIYSIAVLIIIYVQYLKKDEKQFLQYKIYMMMLKTTMLLLSIDMLSRFDGKPDTIYPYINYIGNFFVFLLNLSLPSLWLIYVYCQVYQEEKHIKRMVVLLITLNIGNAVMVIMSQFFGWYYYIDAKNIYHRGPLFGLSAFLVIGLNVLAIIIVIVNRKKIDKKNYSALIWYSVPPFICIFLQLLFYGMSLMLNGITLSLLILFVTIQNQSMYTDYLTGVNNRKKLDFYLKEKINLSTENKTFSAIMLDLNDFKLINDTYGHDEGDNALRAFAKILKSCIREEDFIARFGGDEFCIVLDIFDEKRLKETVERIHRGFDEYNELHHHPYKLDFGIGYAVYDYHLSLSKEDFLKMVDTYMYENKQLSKTKE